MADATVTQARRDDPLVQRDEPARARDVPRVAPAIPRGLWVVWGGFVALMLAFLAFGSVRIGAGNWIGLRLSVRQTWSRFIGFLVGEGASPAIVFVVSAAAVLTLAGAAYLLWLAFALKDAPTDQSAGDAAER